MKPRLVRRRAVALLLCLAGASVQAGTLQLDRTRLDLSGKRAIAELSITNAGAAPALIQSEVFAWGQSSGGDALTPSRDLLVSPPIFEVMPGARQLVRVGLLGSPDEGREVPYRLVLQEVLRPADAAEGRAVSMLLRISLPVFVQPPVTAEPVLRWRAVRTARGLQVTVENSGNAHAKVTGLAVALPEGTVLAEVSSLLAYVLPGERRSWDLSSATAEWPRGRLRLSADTDRGRVHADLAVEVERGG